MNESSQGKRPRAIVHLDLDAFYAAVEVLENPDLEGKPVVVGGQPEQRGVVAAASYPARRFGVRSAMPMSRALALCPEAVIVPLRHHVYREYSRSVMGILRQASPRVEQISVDEAFLELTDQVSAWEEAIELARQLQQRVREKVGLSASLGIATNKLVAKVASDQDKPGGLTVVPPGGEATFLAPLPVRVLWVVGPLTAQKLSAMGVTTVGQLAEVSEEELRAQFGRNGVAMARHARGVDSRPITTEYEPKSVSQERTFGRDIADEETVNQKLWDLSQRVAQQLQRIDRVAGTVAIKLRYSDFRTITRQSSMAEGVDSAGELAAAAGALLDRTARPDDRFRLLGIQGTNLNAEDEAQLGLGRQ
jgi:DNA polymerase-4